MKKKELGSDFLAGFMSLLFHGGLIAALIWGADLALFSQDKPAVSANSTPTIEASVIDPKLINDQAKKIRERKKLAEKKEAERIKRLEKKAQQLEKQREAEEQRLRELQAQKLAAEKATRDAELERQQIAEEKAKAAQAMRVAQEKAKAAEAEKIKQLAQAKKAEQIAQQAQKDQLAAEKQKLAAEKEKEAAEKAREKAEQEAIELEKKKAEQEAALNELFSDLESETQHRSSARENVIAKEVDQWSSRYKSMIQNRWLVDSTMIGKTCRLNIRLAPDGLLISVNTLSGDAALCRSAKASIIKVNKFPMPTELDVKEQLRDINLNFAQ